MSRLRAFATYYVRNALPFLTGLAFGLILFRFDIPLPWQVGIGAVLVVAGPFAIQSVLVLIVEALRGGPGAGSDGAADERYEYDDEPGLDPARRPSDER